MRLKKYLIGSLKNFHGIKSPKKPVCGGFTIENEKEFVVELEEWKASTKNYNKEIYFLWRYYYAKVMLRTIKRESIHSTYTILA